MAETQPLPMQPELLDYQQVKMMLELSIAFVEKKANVSLEDDFLSRPIFVSKRKTETDQETDC